MTKTAATARDGEARAEAKKAAGDPSEQQQPKLWYVVRTNIKCEKRALSALTAAGYEAYLPLMRRDVVHHRTKKVITREFVLFNRYLFVAQPAAGADWFRLRRCDGVEAVLGSGGRYLPVDTSAVEAFRRAEAELEFDETRAARLRRKEIGRTRKATAAMQFPAGADIRVKKDFAHAHPFGGLFGKVDSVRGKGVVTAMIELFGRLTPVEFQADELERVAGLPDRVAARLAQV